MEKTGVTKGTVKSMRGAAFRDQRSETVKVLIPGVSLFCMKSMDNTMDIVYHVQNESSQSVKVTLDFTGSNGVELLSPVTGNESMKVCADIPQNEKVIVAHIRQNSNSACTLRMGCGVSHSTQSNQGEVVGAGVPAQQGRSRTASVGVGEPEKKQLAPGIFLLKQKISNPLGYQYSFCNQKTNDFECSMDFTGSTNVRVVGTGEMKVAVVAASSETVPIATVTQKDGGASILVKTKIGVKELSTASKPRRR